MKSKTVQVKDAGAYVQCYQRIGERPLADLNFFDGDRDLEEVIKRRDALNEAIACMTEWEHQPDMKTA